MILGSLEMAQHQNKKLTPEYCQ